MITPAATISSTPARNSMLDLRQTSTRTESESDLPALQRSTESSILPAQIVSVTTLGEVIAPADENQASVGSRSLGGQDASFASLDASEAALVRELAAQDAEVRQHEQAHKSVAGSLAGAVQLDYQRGPDGKLYAVAGEVDLRVPPNQGDPEAVIRYAEQVIQAALAPVEPSTQDRQVAAAASAMLAEAQAELAKLDEQERTAEAPTEGALDASNRSEENRDTSQNARIADESGNPIVQGSTEGAKEIWEQMQADREASSESLAEFRETLNDVNQRFAEVNQRLAQLGVLETLYEPGAVFETRA